MSPQWEETENWKYSQTIYREYTKSAKGRFLQFLHFTKSTKDACKPILIHKLVKVSSCENNLLMIFPTNIYFSYFYFLLNECFTWLFLLSEFFQYKVLFNFFEVTKDFCKFRMICSYFHFLFTYNYDEWVIFPFHVA